MRSVIAVANQFIQLAQAAEVVLQGAQLQGLVYLAHGLRVATLNKPLIGEPLLAHRDGVVIASLNAAGAYGSRPVHSLLAQIVPSEDGSTLRERVVSLKADDPVRALVTQIWNRYGRLSAYELIVVLRGPGGPWDTVWNDPGRLTGALQTASTGLRGDDHENERAAIIADALVRRWFRQQMIQEQKARAVADGLERTIDIAANRLDQTISAAVEPELRSL